MTVHEWIIKKGPLTIVELREKRKVFTDLLWDEGHCIAHLETMSMDNLQKLVLKYIQ